MELIRRWFGKEEFRRSKSVASRGSDSQRDESRRELLGLAVRDALRKHGIPAQWITAETFSALTGSRVRGMHLRLVVREWQPKFLAYTVALQKAITARLLRLDPLSQGWMAGISWKFEVVDESLCPGLPAAQYWDSLRETEPARPLGARALLDSLLGADKPAPQDAPAGSKTDFRPTEPMHR